MSSTLSTAHRLEIRRALYLTSSNKKLGLAIRGHLLPLTNYLCNEQYALVQPIASKFAERYNRPL